MVLLHVFLQNLLLDLSLCRLWQPYGADVGCDDVMRLQHCSPITQVDILSIAMVTIACHRITQCKPHGISAFKTLHGDVRQLDAYMVAHLLLCRLSRVCPVALATCVKGALQCECVSGQQYPGLRGNGVMTLVRILPGSQLTHRSQLSAITVPRAHTNRSCKTGYHYDVFTCTVQ